MKLGFVRLLEPRKTIGSEEDPYMYRWIVFRLPFFGIFLHKFMRSDYDRALHDHPWHFVTVILKRGYDEVTERGTFRRRVGDILYRPATWRHRVVLTYGNAWTLIFVSRRVRKWGYWIKGQWCWWRKYNYEKNFCEEEVLWEDGND